MQNKIAKVSIYCCYFIFTEVTLKNMDSEVKYTDRFLKLNRDSSVEESKLAYDEMAPSWEKVYKCSDKWISVLWFRELYFPFLTYRKKILSAHLKR